MIIRPVLSTPQAAGGANGSAAAAADAQQAYLRGDHPRRAGLPGSPLLRDSGNPSHVIIGLRSAYIRHTFVATAPHVLHQAVRHCFLASRRDFSTPLPGLPNQLRRRAGNEAQPRLRTRPLGGHRGHCQVHMRALPESCRPQTLAPHARKWHVAVQGTKSTRSRRTSDHIHL